jgi:hypothetical protein
MLSCLSKSRCSYSLTLAAWPCHNQSPIAEIHLRLKSHTLSHVLFFCLFLDHVILLKLIFYCYIITTVMWILLQVVIDIVYGIISLVHGI